MKEFVLNTPLLGPLARTIYRRLRPSKPFEGSRDYWEERYRDGGNSGDGSYRALADFKAEVLNGFVAEQGVRSVIEYGCGDGNQLRLANYPDYTGFDVSPRAIEMCRQIFGHDAHKRFLLLDEYRDQRADLTLSLDVIYHLVEDEVFHDYMARLFDSSERFVIVYSSDTDENPPDRSAHVRHRRFSDWVAAHRPQWRVARHIPNRYPFKGDTRTGSFADFFVFERGH